MKKSKRLNGKGELGRLVSLAWKAALLLILPYGASGAAGSLSPALEPDEEPGLRLRQTVVEVMTGSVEKVVVMVGMEVVVLVVIVSCWK